MIMDENLEFASALDVSAAAGTALVGDVIDLDSTGRNLLDTLYLVIQVTTAFATATAAEVRFRLASDAAAAIATNGAATEHGSSRAFDTTQLTVGSTVIIPIGGGTLAQAEQYLGLLVTTTSATTTAGSISAFLTATPQDWKALPDAVN